jgi:hypothetical protein
VTGNRTLEVLKESLELNSDRLPLNAGLQRAIHGFESVTHRPTAFKGGEVELIESDGPLEFVNRRGRRLRCSCQSVRHGPHRASEATRRTERPQSDLQ